jgi:hypothetical protein
LVIVLIICLSLYCFTDTAYAISPESNNLSNIKPEVNIKDTNININNSNISVPADPLVKGLANVGIGTAIAGSMNAITNTVKSTSMPPAIKFGIIVAGSAIAGLLITATNAANSITQNKINFSS